MERPANPFFDDMFDSIGGLFGPKRIQGKQIEGAYVLQVALPGLQRDEVKVEVKGTKLTIDASEGQFSAALKRTFEVGDGLDTETLSAELKDGVLTVTLPASGTKSESVNVEIK